MSKIYNSKIINEVKSYVVSQESEKKDITTNKNAIDINYVAKTYIIC